MDIFCRVGKERLLGWGRLTERTEHFDFGRNVERWGIESTGVGGMADKHRAIFTSRIIFN